MKRVVTGHDRSGKSVFVSEGEPPKQVSHAAGGIEITEVWGTDEVPVVPASSQDPTTFRHQYFPDPAGTRFVVVRFRPAAEAERAAARGVDVAAATKEFFDQFPGLGDLMEADHPGMHASRTVDYIIVLSGEIDLELDDGATRRLKAGDCVVQNGTRHAWRNPGSVDCVLGGVVVGARSKRS
jgi:mannose-6-phosphate isomerase-like protein (cupin superfamily)